MKLSWSTIRRGIAAVLAVGGIAITVSVNIEVNVNQPPLPPEELGWKPDAAEIASGLIAESEPLQIAGGDGDNASKNVRLWNYSLLLRDGEHIPTFRQEHGDCVAASTAQAMHYLQYVTMAAGELDSNSGQPLEFRLVYVPYIYGASRVYVGGGKIRGQGSIGAWAAKACEEYGVLPADTEGVPEYSGAVSKRWGDPPGPPERFKELAMRFRIRATAHCESAADVRDAVVNGYPVTIASRFGTKTIAERDGRQVARWDGRWSHQMCVIGYDGSPGLQGGPYFYVLNSWGEKSHPPPLQGEPPGGFWVTDDTMDKITDSGDCWAYSNFDGFPSRQLDFNLVGQQFIAPGIAAEDVGGPVRTQTERNHDMQSLGLFLILCAILVLILDAVRNIRNKKCVAALLGLIFVGGSHVHLAAGEPLSTGDFDLTAPVVAQADPVPIEAFDLTRQANDVKFPVALTLFIIEDCPHCPTALANIKRLKNVEVTVMIDRHPPEVKAFPCWCWEGPNGVGRIKATTDVAAVARQVAKDQGFDVAKILRDAKPAASRMDADRPVYYVLREGRILLPCKN